MAILADATSSGQRTAASTTSKVSQKMGFRTQINKTLKTFQLP